MITNDGRGILNDWDHAGRIDNLSPGIVGTTLLHTEEMTHRF